MARRKLPIKGKPPRTESGTTRISTNFKETQPQPKKADEC